MSNHYYSSKPVSQSDLHQIHDQLRGKKMTFWTDAGVFSKGGIDFGSRLLIETMDIPEDARVLEIGCGYGPIGLSAAMLAVNGFITMVDVNERAIELSKKNVILNHIDNVEVAVSDLYAEVAPGPYDRIICNPPIRAGKQIVHAIFDQAPDYLSDMGELWIVIQKKQGAPSAIKKLQTLFEEVDVVEKEGGYQIIRSRTCIQ